MPQFIIEIPNNEESVSAPVVASAIVRVIRTFKFYEEFDFNYSALGSTWLVLGSQIDLLTQDRSQNRLTTDEKVSIEVNERYNEDAVRATAIKEGTEKNIFEDPRTKTTMHPGYQQMIADCTLTFRFRSRPSAENFRKRMRLAQTKSVDGMRLEVKYSYIIPYPFLDILKRIYTLMETKHGYGISLGDWLKECFTKNLTTLANQSGDKTVLAIAEVNENVVILVNTPDEVPEKEQFGEADSWSIPITFSIHYDRPDVMRMRFQHLINNQFLGMDIASRFKVLRQDYLKARTHIASLDALKAGDIPLGKNPLSGVTSPVFDDWLPSSLNRSYIDAIRIMVMLDETNLNDVVNLREIADYDITPNMLNWLTLTHATATTYSMNIFWIRGWAWDEFSAESQYQLNDQLHLISNDPLNPRINYHVTVGVCVNPSILDDSVWLLLGQNRAVLDEWLSYFAPNLIPVVNFMLVQYHELYRDTSEVGWFQNPTGVYDPTLETSLPSFVISRLKDILTTTNKTTSSSPGAYDGNHPYIISAIDSWNNNQSAANQVTRPVSNPRLITKAGNTNSAKTVLEYGVIVTKKGS